MSAIDMKPRMVAATMAMVAGFGLLTMTGCAMLGAGPMAGQIVPDPTNKAWMVYQGGGPFFMCGPGDPEGLLFRGQRNADGTRDGDQDALIESLIESGANSVYVMAVRSHGGDARKDTADLADPKYENPFIDGDPTLGLDEDILAQWDRWFTRLDGAGIATVLFIYDDSASVWETGDVVGPEERAFLRGLVDRFEHHTHLIWCVAEEYEERFTAQRVSAIAAEIRRADDHRHPIAVHKLHGLAFDELADDPNIDQFAIQYNVDTAEELHAGVVQAWRRAAGRYNLNMAEVAQHGTGREARLRSWAAAMGGAYVMILGMDIANTARADLIDCGRLVRFFEGTDVHRMAPHDELAAGDTQYVLANSGASYIAYASQRQGAMALRSLPCGAYDMTWLDIATGTTVQQTRQTLAGDTPSLMAPAGFGGEVAVYLRRVDR